jgi:hypothetical protein
MRLQHRTNLPQFVRQSLVEHHPIFLVVADDHHTNCSSAGLCHNISCRSPLGQSPFRKWTLTSPLNRGEEAGYMIIIDTKKRTVTVCIELFTVYVPEHIVC